MAYAAVADVQSEFKGVVFSATSAVTDTQVTGFIAQAEAYINGKIDSAYVTPVTGPQSVLILKMISIWLVADRVSKILEVKSASEEANTTDKSLTQMAEAKLEEIKDLLLVLVDATRKSVGGAFKSANNDDGVEPVFRKNVVQW